MSIPKIIHYCWFGGGPINPESRKCIESWKKYCPDYKIIEWNEQNFEISQNRYAQQAYEAKKYAFVSDYVRLAVLYEYGGIYLDTDVELVRPLDELLEHKGFIGMEHSAPSPYGRTLLVNTGSGVGAEPGCEMIGKMLAAYRNAAFIQETGEPDLRTCTQRDTPLFTKAGLQQKDEQQELDGFLVLPTRLLECYRQELGFYACTVPALEQHVLARFIAGGHYERHLSRMRKEYRDRRSATISAFRASPLASHVTFSEEGAGLHFLLRLDTNRSDEELRRLTAEAGIRLSFLSEYAAVPDPRFAHTLVINYAGLSQSDLEEALQLLTDVLLPLLA